MANKEKKKCLHYNLAPISLHSLGMLSYTYCYNCGILIIIENNSKEYLYKPLNMEKKCESDPFTIVEMMNKNNTNIVSNGDLISPWYFKSRKIILGFLQKLSLSLKFSDGTFYTALTYLDFLLKTRGDELKGKKLEMMIIACFVLSSKFAENDIFEPELTQFESANGKYLFNANDLAETEINIIKQLNYELIYHSVYDWLFLLLNNGFVFEDELIGKPADHINKIYASCKKSLAVITPSSLLLDYDPLIIAFCLIEITRNSFNLDSKRIEIIKQLYKIDNDESYENCFIDMQWYFLYVITIIALY